MDLWTRDHGLAGAELDNLRLICEFVVAIYIKQWFAIKTHHQITHGAKHLLKQVSRVSMTWPDFNQHCQPNKLPSVSSHIFPLLE